MTIFKTCSWKHYGLITSFVSCNQVTAFNLRKHRSDASTIASNHSLQRSMGQPTFFTHPYLMKEGEVTPGLTRKDYADRRSSLMSSLHDLCYDSDEKQNNKKENVVILFGEPTVYMSEDVPYPFHQNANFRYLTGFLEPGSCLVMESVNRGNSPSSHTSTLLVPARDSSGEMWHGPRAGTDGALELTGVENTDTIDNFSKVVSKYTWNEYNIWYDFQKPVNFHLHMQHMRPFLTEVYNKKMKISSVTEPVHKLRHIKSEQEIQLLSEAGLITAQSLKRAMTSCYPGMNERVIHAMVECECKFQGAHALAYPPVVAGGARANTLHYVINNQRVLDGELVLVDAGANYHGYVADVTRTWPINGRFSPAQRRVHDIVVRVQRACIDMCRPGVSLDNIYRAMALLLAQELMDGGVLAKKVDGKEVQQVTRKFCPHHVGHWLGMDVHDTSSLPRSAPLQAGMVVTIEPGIYIREDDVTVPAEFRGIAIRIEDDVVVTSDHPIVLSDSCPKDADEIEKIMSSNNTSV